MFRAYLPIHFFPGGGVLASFNSNNHDMNSSRSDRFDCYTATIMESGSLLKTLINA